MKTPFSKPLHCLPLLAATLLMSAMSQAEPPVKVYILAGQSNMQGKGTVDGEVSKPGNSLRHLVNHDPKKEFQFLVNPNGEWAERCDVWAHYDLAPFGGLRYGTLKPGYGSAAGQIGPELGFGLVMGDADQGQVLLIKAAWGGKSLGYDFQPPSVGKYAKPQRPQDAGYFYQRTLDLVTEVTENIATLFPDYKGQGVEIAGLCWHQGWNDQYGGLDASYESNMAAFIKDIRSAEHGLGVPGLPVVIATSGNIMGESLIKQGQLAMADAQKHPEFAGNVAVVDTDKPYGPDKMGFKFGEDGLPSDKVGYHWNSSALCYLNMGRAMAAEMQKLAKPKLPSRLTAHGSEKGVVLNWQFGTEKPTGIEITRNGKSIGDSLKPDQTTCTDTAALPGVNSYELLIDLPSGNQKLSASCDTSATDFSAYRSVNGVMLSWKARGKYDGFRISRDGKVIADKVAADARSFEDPSAPAKGKVIYAIQPTTGNATAAECGIHLGPIDAGGALVYEPFDYPADAKQPQVLLGKSGAVGTKGAYFTSREKPTDQLPLLNVGSPNFGALPVTGNCANFDGRGGDCIIELDEGIKKAGLLEDGAALWISFIFDVHDGGRGACVSLQSADGKEAIGFIHDRSTNTFAIQDGAEQKHLLTKGVSGGPNLFVGKMVWGANGGPDQFLTYHLEHDMKLPEKTGRVLDPFNIDQTKLSRLVLKGGRASDVDEIRVGPTFESVVGGGS